MLHLTMERVSSSQSSESTPTATSTSVSPSTSNTDEAYRTQLVIKGRAYDVEQFETAVKLKFSKLSEQTLVGDVFGHGLDQLYETISVMANAFVERTEGGNVSHPLVA